ncbi:MAG: hypothetical protein ABSF38_20320 [Verrucomicrobiota bacterium]|jgi:hypothetical protein
MVTKLNARTNVQAEAPSTGDQCQFLVKGQVAQRLQKTPRTIEIWSRRGILPSIKIGRSVLFFWPDVESALREKFTINRLSSATVNKSGQIAVPRRAV